MTLFSLEDRFRNNVELKEKCSEFVSSMSQVSFSINILTWELLTLLLGARTLPEGAGYEQEKIAATMKIMVSRSVLSDSTGILQEDRKKRRLCQVHSYAVQSTGVFQSLCRSCANFTVTRRHAILVR